MCFAMILGAWIGFSGWCCPKPIDAWASNAGPRDPAIQAHTQQTDDSPGSKSSMRPPEIQWHRAYGGSGEESHPHYIIETRSGDLVMVGETGFVEDASAKILVVKTTSNGKLKWKKEFGDPGYNLGNSVVEAPDGDLVIAGCLDKDAALIKLDAETGSLRWEKTWDWGTEDALEGVDIAKDGGLIATGYRNGLGEGTFLNWGKGVLIKTDQKGTLVWKKNLASYISAGYRVQTVTDGYVVSGHPRSEEEPDFNLLKVDGKGSVLWAKTYNTIYWGFDMDARGNMLLAGHTRKSPLSKNWDVELTQVDSDGTKDWTQYFGQPRGYDGRWIHDEVWGVRSTPDGGWLAVAGTGDETGRYEGRGHVAGNSGQWKVYLIKTDAEGDLQWEAIYGSPSADWAGEDICLTKDGGAVIANDCGAFGFTKIGGVYTPE